MAELHCLVFEPDSTGHRLQHVRHLSEALLELGCRVSLALEMDAPTRVEYQVHLAAIEPRVELHPRITTRRGRRLKIRLQWVTDLRDSIAELRPHWVYVPYADGITQAAAIQTLLLGGGALVNTPVEGQLMRGKYGYRLRSIQERLSAATNRWLTLRNPWRVTHLLDPLIMRGLNLPGPSKRFRLIPEPVEERMPIDRREARQLLGIPGDGRYVAMIGVLEVRKGIEEMLGAFASAKLADNDRVLLVGKSTPPIRQLIEACYGSLLRRGRIVMVDRYVNDEELGAAFFAADVVAVTHVRQIGSSGTLVRAAAAERYLLTSDFGWVGWVTELFRLGASVNVSNNAVLTEALESALERSADYRRTESARRFCQFHTIKNQQAHWVREIAAQHGLALGRLADRTEWDWVMAAAAQESAVGK